MKKLLVFLAAFALIIGCGTNSTQTIKKGTPEYKFFQTVADSLGYTYFSPENDDTIISTDVISVKTGDILPLAYQAFGGNLSRVSMMDSIKIFQLFKTLSTSTAEKKLLVWEAEQSGIEISDDSLEQNMKSIFPKYSDKEAFEKQLSEHNITIEHLKQDVRNQMTIDVYLNKFVFTSDKISDSEIEEYYKHDKTATVRHILFLTQGKSETEKMQIRKKAQKVLSMAKAGKNFSSLAKQYSEDPGSKDKGGIYEDFHRGEMVKPFEEAAFTLPIGGISNLVETQFGYHIIKVVNRKKESRPFEEAKSDLKLELLEKNKRDIFFDYIDSLKTSHKYTENFTSL